MSLAKLKANDRAVIRQDGRQILPLHNGKDIFACANRCPHEGYPLSEGSLQGSVLTCNWHNWKFDLATGATLMGGGKLPFFRTKLEAGQILVDLTEPDPCRRQSEILAALAQALEVTDESRLLSEAVRLEKLGADPVDAVRCAIPWLAERLEFGTTHAIAAMPDWLALHDATLAPDEKLAALGEILGHISEDGRGGKTFPFPASKLAWNEEDFLEAVEAEDETRAIALARGALAAGIAIEDLFPSLAAAALAHYNDFGHSLIYSVKTVEVARRLGPSAGEPLLLMLVRSLTKAAREDLLPEFSAYQARLAAWGAKMDTCPPLGFVRHQLLISPRP